jgi:hypothetical protein
MTRFTYTILLQAQPGREEELIEWYGGQHVVDVCKMPGVLSGKLFKLDFHRVYELVEAPRWTVMTIYELDCDDPEPTINRIRDTSGSPAMPASDAVSRVGMIQVAGHLLAEAAPPA